MAYKKEKARILAGSINWLAPRDLLPDGDALNLTGFRSDQLGALRSRFGSTLAGTASGAIRSLIKALGLRYQGSTSLFRDFAAVDAGYSGEPMGLADFLDYLWVMDSSRRRKDNGSDNFQWHIDPPDSPPTVESITELTTDVATFDDSEGWTVSPSGSESFDDTEKKEGTHALLIEAIADESYQLDLAASPDLSMVGSAEQDIEDKFRIWIYASKWKRLESITLQVDVDDGEFGTNFYEVILPHSFLKKRGKGWARIEIRRSEKSDDALPFFKRTGGDSTKDWSTVAALRIIFDTRGDVDVRFDDWEVFGSLDGTLEGEDIQYGYTFLNDDEHESSLSELSAKTAFNRTGARISGFASSPDAQVTQMHIYRTGGKLGGRIWRVTESPIDISETEYDDLLSDADAIALGFEAPLDNDPPPAAQVLVGPYLGRLIAFGGARMYWSKLNQPWAWPGSDSEVGNHAPVGDSGEDVVAATMRPRFIHIYKENTIWRLVGDPDDINGELEIVNYNYGAVGPQAVTHAGGVDYFVSKEGVYEFDGQSARKISDKIDPIFKGQTVTLATGVTISPISARDKSVLEFVNGRLYFSYATSGGTPNRTLALDLATGRWYSIDLGYSALYYEGANGDLLGGKSTGAVHALETGTTDAGSAAINLDFFSRYFDAGANDTKKTFEDVTIDADPGGATLAVTLYLNDGASSIALGNLTGSGRQRFVFQINSGDGVQAYNAAVRIAEAASAEVVINDVVLNHYFEARQGKSFDTDEQDCGTVKMKKIREAQIDLENATTVTIDLLTDQPGAQMTVRQSPTVASGTGRRKEHVVFNADYIGHLIRNRMSGSDFHVYGLRWLIQTYGTYLLGGEGEFWFSNVIDFGSERVKLIKEIEIVYDMAAGAATFVVQSDQPGGALTQRDSQNLVTTTGERSLKLRYDGTLKGRLFTFRATPNSSANLIIESIRAWIKLLGEPNASPWTWVDLPVEKTQDAIWFDVQLPTDEVG